MKIQDIIAANKLRQQEAKKLNVRAGETLFKVFSIAELTAWVMERLSGARRLAEIVNEEALRLPELDREIVGKVLADNPDKITVLDREVAVEYSDYRREPLVRIDFRGDQSKDWAKLPVEGVRLPSNREVVLYSAVDGHSYYIEAPSSQFVPKVREIFNRQQWETFVASADKPVITLPDLTNPSSQVPAVCEHQYGVCIATESPLTAFGAVTYTPSGYWSSEKFEVKWFGKREEAEVERTKASDALVLKQKELLEKIQKQAGDIREITIDRRGQYRKPELNGQRIDSPSSYELTPDYFWSDLLDLVEEFGRGQNAFAIYRGDSPLLVYLNREKIERVLPQVQDLIKTLGADLTSEGKESFWRKLEEFRTKEASEARVIREEREALEYARQETERQRIETEDRRKKDQPATKGGGMNSLGDAFAKLGL